MLAIEEGKFHDIVVAGIHEDYYSLSLKTYAMLYFKDMRVPSAKCLVKADSDNVLVVRNYERLCEETSMVLQRSRTKWKVPESIYPHPQFPMYCSTGTYMLCGKVPQNYRELKTHLRMLPEDALFTGIFAEKAGIRRKHVGGMSFIDAPEYICRESKHTYSIHMNRAKDPQRYFQRLISMEGFPCRLS
ncbi:unnamed protein product [Haemonchus placei]|uniref:Hexosyltransferase n=1 Tax=Haemonchus placei TaxID=6290 RepID=A0A3P7VUK5_HAEPC|nr:unnamed protein product [Haemonchus placei]